MVKSKTTSSALSSNSSPRSSCKIFLNSTPDRTGGLAGSAVVAKKKEMERVELEREVGDLKHQIRMLLWDMKCSGVKPSNLKNELLPLNTNETNESCEPDPSTEQEDLDEIYKQ